MDIFINIFNGSTLLLTGLLYSFLPDLINRYLLFGVTVNDEILQRRDTARVKKLYRKTALILCSLILFVYIVFSSILEEEAVSVLFPVLLSAQMVLDFILYLTARKKIKSIKKESNPVTSGLLTIETEESGKFTVINPLWFSIYFLIIAGVTYLSFNKYPELPERIAVHFNSLGTADGFMVRSYRAVLLLPVTMTLFTFLFIGINTALKKAKKVSGVARGKLSFEQENKFRRLWSIALFITGLILLVVFSVIQLKILGILKDNTSVVYIPLGGSLLIIVLITALSVYTGQSGSRLKFRGKSRDVVDRDDDEFWKAGIFYVNRRDPALFVPKRFGIGLTVNFGNPVSWIILISLLGLILYSIISR